AGVGGATLLTAQWWPWVEFRMVRRVPARSFRPAPSVDGGIVHAVRRRAPLVPSRDPRAYQACVARVCAGPGRGRREVLRRAGMPPRAVDAWLRREGITASTRPRLLRAEQWASLWAARRG